MFSIEGPMFGRSADCEQILHALPDWFGIESAIVEYVEEVATLPTFVARSGESKASDRPVVGFLSVKRHTEFAAEMFVLGVLEEHHRRGIGRALVEAAEDWCRGEGIEYLQVKTLGPSRPCDFYERTRAFYSALGYRPLEELKTLWNEANPCLLQVKRL